MFEFSNRDVVRAINKGNAIFLERCFLNGLSFENTTETEQWNLLHQATIFIGKIANEQSIKLLLSKGVNVNAVDVYGNAPIHYAIRNNDFTTVKLFAQAGANLDIYNNEGINPLHQSLLLIPESVALISFLVKSGAYISESAFVLSSAMRNKKVTDILEGRA